jgi:hypothetical protein
MDVRARAIACRIPESFLLLLVPSATISRVRGWPFGAFAPFPFAFAFSLAFAFPLAFALAFASAFALAFTAGLRGIGKVTFRLDPGVV